MPRLRFSNCIIVVLISVFAAGCQSSVVLTRQGTKAEEGGLIDIAANKYFEAATKKPSNIKALQGLKRTGQRVLGMLIQEFDDLVLVNQPKAAIETWHLAEDYKRRLETTGLRLYFPDAKRQVYEAIKDSHLDESYREANIFLELEDFDAAFHVFKAIQKLNPDYKDVKQLSLMSFCEPRYRNAKQALTDGRFRSALAYTQEISRVQSSYKDVAKLRDDILEQGQFGVVIQPIKNETGIPNLGIEMERGIEAAMSKIRDPFFTLVDRDNLDFILQENQLRLSGITAENSSQIGRLARADAFVSAKVSNCRYHRSKLHKRAKTGYEAYRVRIKNSDGISEYQTRFKEVTYHSYTQSAYLTLRLDIEMISATTSEVLFSRSITKTISDEVSYHLYPGNKENFYSTKFSNLASQILSKAATALLFTGRKTIQDQSVMVKEASEFAVAKASGQLQQQIINSVK